MASILLLVVAVPACAVSRKYDGEVSVTLRDGRPCFYANDPKLVSRAGSQWWDVSVGMSRREAEFHAVWVTGIKASLPVSPNTCVPYGAEPPTSKVQFPAAPLSNSVSAYEVFLGTGRSGADSGGRYGLRFCYGQDPAGKAVLKRWDSVQLKCSSESLVSESTER